MRGIHVAPWIVVVAAGMLLHVAACLPFGAPCCDDDVDCAEGARCFEGRCAPRCDNQAELADAQCDEGERCVAGAGVCRADDPEVELERCSYRDSSR
ncbi:MAG: hypothetical protein HYS27_14905 [Deltaproteobacteria bacterium]|nr:hypothetical protein [Deltaproteobacteria bacterium]